MSDSMIKRVVMRYSRYFFGMPNLRPTATGIKGAVIYVSTRLTGGTEAQHGPRIKVCPGAKMIISKTVVVTLADPRKCKVISIPRSKNKFSSLSN